MWPGIWGTGSQTTNLGVCRRSVNFDRNFQLSFSPHHLLKIAIYFSHIIVIYFLFALVKIYSVKLSFHLSHVLVSILVLVALMVLFLRL